MAKTFTYNFEELPLAICPGIEGALINGSAEIEYDRNGWQVKEVFVEGYKHLTQAERAADVKPWVMIPAPTALDHLIVGRLNNEWRGKVDNALSDHIESERESAPDTRADRRLELVR